MRAASLGIRGEEAMQAIRSRIRAVGGTPDPADLREQMRRAYAHVGTVRIGEVDVADKTSTIQFSPELLRKFASRVAIADPWEYLRRLSPVPPLEIDPASFLGILYNLGDRIIVFNQLMSQGQAVFRVGESEQSCIPTAGPEGIWFLVQPVDGRIRYVPRLSKESRRSEESVTRWPYLVLESDKADPRDWLRLLVQLPLAIVAIYTSGGRSIHALVQVDAADKAQWDAIKQKIAKAMVPLGADPNALSAVRLSRLPQCLRGEKLQELLYLNPDADGTPICVSVKPGLLH